MCIACSMIYMAITFGKIYNRVDTVLTNIEIQQTKVTEAICDIHMDIKDGVSSFKDQTQSLTDKAEQAANVTKESIKNIFNLKQ